MRRLPSLILLLGWVVGLQAQSPHGAELQINCASCHTADGWDIPASHWKFDKLAQPGKSRVTGWKMPVDTSRFNHYATNFALTGQHATADCRQCHASLVFTGTSMECNTCHTDVHNQTVGNDCARCHNTNHWLVDNITELHQNNGFPLVGAHALANCKDCHKSESALRFDRIGNDCISCHTPDYMATTNPNHATSGFSTNCVDCHDHTGFDWASDGINHNFFPLTKGHDISDCAQCHTNGNFANTPATCVSCHQADYNAAANPQHTAANFSQNCVECHTTDPGWMPASFVQHDAAYFPIYSGTHKGEWNQCSECHTNPSNYAEFTCTTCHANPETDNEHNGIGGYAYNSPACLACHPTGDGNGNFDHNTTNFPLKGAHQAVNCAECHSSGYAGTPTNCSACHLDNYNQTTNPNHTAAHFPTDCASCHTETAWTPASFDHDGQYFPIYSGKHKGEWNQCAECHTNPSNYAEFSCITCHTNPETNNDHNGINGYAYNSPACLACHPAGDAAGSFDHNTTSFPLTGAHITTSCNQCHANGYAGTPTACSSCHTPDYNQSLNPNHVALAIPTDCAGCHTTVGWEPATFAIHNNYYPLNGAHASIANQCATCHNGNYNTTPNTCAGCHQSDYNQATNPNHVTAGFPTDCNQCHSESAWDPSTFNHDAQYFPIYSGKHKNKWDQCSECHTNPSNYAIFSCTVCHTNPGTNNDHQGVNGYSYSSPACLSCHPNGN